MDTPVDPGRTLDQPEPHYEATTKTEILGFSRTVDPEIEPDTRRRWDPTARPPRRRGATFWFALLYAFVFAVGVGGIWLICAQA